MSFSFKRAANFKLLFRQILWALAIGGIFGSMVWLVSNLPEPPKEGAETVALLGELRNSSRSTNSKGRKPFSKGINNKTIGTEWCAAGTEKKKKLPEPVFALFREWISSQGQQGGAVGLKENQVGLSLAKKRRVALKNLIQTNPRLALRQIIPSTTRKHLPEEICAELADIVSGVGNLEVLNACFGPKEGYRQTIFRTLRMHDGRQYNVSAYGQRSLFQEKIGMSVLGAAIDGELALLDSPARVLGKDEAIESELSPDQTHVEICGELLSFDSREDAQNYSRRVRKKETRGGKVLSYDLFRASGQTLSTTSYQYQILDVNLSWQDARIVAQGLGGDLAQIDSAAERTTIAGLINSAGFTDAWIGNSNYLALLPNETNATLSNQDKRPYVVEFPLSPFASLSQDNTASPVKVLVIPARYKDQDTALNGSGQGNFSPQTAESIYKQMEATRTFYLRESNGRSRLDYNTTSTVTLPEDQDFYDWAADNGGVFGYLPAHAMAAAANQGYDITGYDKFVFITTAAHKGYGGLGGGSFAHCPAWVSGVIIHELGHCFGLPHANQWVSFGESPISDDGFEIDYGNPMSVMGGSGHMDSPDEVAAEGAEQSQGAASFTLWAKDVISTNDPNGFYRAGVMSLPASELRGCDIIEIETNSTDSMITESPLALDDDEYSNFYRIYHHDYDLSESYISSLPIPQQEFLMEFGLAPYGLKEGVFLVSIPEGFVLHDDFEDNGSFKASDRQYVPKFVGTGNDVNASLERMANGNFKLTILDGGSGFCVEPNLVFSETNGTAAEVAIHKDWIGIEQNGTFSSTTLLEKADWALTTEGFARGLRGIVAPSSPYGPDGANVMEFNATTGQFVDIPAAGQYWVGFRREFSHRGLTLTLSNKLLDMTRETQEKYSDGALLIGRTYSDYGTDFHVTPIRHGGTYPMEYIDVVVHFKTHNGLDGVFGNSDDNNTDPVANLILDKQSPAVGETVSLSISVEDPDGDKDFAYAWFVNDVMLDQDEYLNRSSISYNFDKVGYQKIRAEVSDMKGGMASIARTIEVGGPEKLNFSTIEGRVTGKEGKPVRGLRVVAQKALPIVHRVTWEGSEIDDRSKRFHIDGVESPDLSFNRGQWHRFILEDSLTNVGLSFNEGTDPYPARIKANMGLRFHMTNFGAGYSTSPTVTISGLYDQSYQNRFILGPDWHENHATFLAGTQEPDKIVLVLPRAASILYPTEVEAVTLIHGGKGYVPGDYLTVNLERQATWHTYHPWIPPFVKDANGNLNANADYDPLVDATDVNATLEDANITARVDGVGTISVNDNGDGYPGTPSVVVVGRGSGVDASGTLGGKKDVKNDELGSVAVNSTGLGFDADSTFAVAVYPPNPKAYWSFDNISSRPTMLPRTPNWTTYVKPNLIHRWKFDELENNNSTFADSIGDNNMTAWNSGAAIGLHNSFDAGKHWKALDLNGTASKITLPIAVDPSEGFTVSLWARITAGGGDLVSMHDGGATNGFSLSVAGAADATANARTGTLATPGQFNSTASNVFVGNVWSHLALAYSEKNGTAGTWSFYVNGDLVKEEMTENIPTAGSAVVGDAFTGQIDELEMYSRGLTAAEVKELAGMYVLDTGGNSNHGVLVGGDETAVISGAGNSQVSHALDMNGSVYVDLFPSIGGMNGMSKGTITAWYATNGRKGGNGAWEDMTILSASDKDDNASAVRLMVRDTGQIGFSVTNDGVDVVDVYTEDVFRDPDVGSPDEWHHVAVTVDENGTHIYIDGQKRNILSSGGTQSVRGFFSDVQNIDSITLGRHFCSVPTQTEIFEGMLDEVYLFDRVLSASEIQYMINEATINSVQEAIVIPTVDAVGTLKLIDGGSGYREIPELSFTGTHTGGNKAKATAEASLVPTRLDGLAYVDRTGVPLVDVNMSTDQHGMLAQFLLGFRIPPDLEIAPSPSVQDEDAVAKSLFFIPETGSLDIIDAGSGYLEDWQPQNDSTFAILGRGSKPPVFEPVMEPDPQHDGFLRIVGVTLKEKGYGPYDNNTSYLLEQFTAAGKHDYWYLDPQFITGGDLAGPFNSRFTGDSGHAGYPTDTYPAILKVNVADAADVAAGVASAKGDIMSMEVVKGGKYNFGPPTGQDIQGGVGYREAPVIDFSGLLPTHRIVVDGDQTTLHQVLDRVTLPDRGQGYCTPLELRWHGGYGPEDNRSLIVYPKITAVQIEANGSISSITAETNASTNVTNWENLHLSITGAGGRDANASVLLNTDFNPWAFPPGPILEVNGTNATIITDWFGRATGIFERNQSSIEFHFRGWPHNQIYAFDGNTSNLTPTIYDVTPFWGEWVAIPEGNATTTWLSGLTLGGTRYYWEQNGSLFLFTDANRTQKSYFDGNGSIRDAYGNLFVRLTSNGIDYDPPGDTNQILSDGLILGTELNASMQVSWDPAGPAVERNATFEVKLGGSVQSIVPVGNAKGSGYVGPKVVVKGDGEGAVLHPVVKNGRIEKIFIEDPGQGYSEANVTITGGGGLDGDGVPYTKDSGLAPLEANCTAIVINGQIFEVRVDYPGWGYFQPEIVVTGSGSGVEAIPVIENYSAEGTSYKNGIVRVIVTDGGHGFTERPWIKEAPQVQILDYTSERSGDWGGGATFRAQLEDNFGDEVADLIISDAGSYGQEDTLSGQISFNYPSGENDRNATGVPLFDRRLNSLTLADPSGTSITIPGSTAKMLGIYGVDQNGNPTTDGRLATDVNSTFLESPEIKFAKGIDFSQVFQVEPDALTVIPGNGRDYDSNRSYNYVDVFVDGNLSDEFYYYVRDYNDSATGGRVEVKDSVPGTHWWDIPEWQPNQYYVAGQIVYSGASAYESISDHFSSGSFTTPDGGGGNGGGGNGGGGDANDTGDPASSAFAAEVFRLTNEFRADNGVAALTYNSILETASLQHAWDMGDNNFFSHTGLNGSQPHDRIMAQGYQGSATGENIAAGQATPEEVVQAWIDSPGHRANMLNATFNELGVAYYPARNAEFSTYWVQNFGKSNGESSSSSSSPGDGLWRELTSQINSIEGKAAIFVGNDENGFWGYIAKGAETYTDSQGYYSFNDLEPGLYNLAVFHEDEVLQTRTYMSGNRSGVMTQTVSLEGIPEIILEAAGDKDGECTLFWTTETILSAEAGSNSTFLAGVGYGFQKTPALLIIPDSENTGNGVYELAVNRKPDGSLDMSVTSSEFHNRGDKFYVHYRNSSPGVDFWLSDWKTTGTVPNRMNISPDSATNSVEAPIFSIAPGDLSKQFNVTVWDVNSSTVPSLPTTWSWTTDFNKSSPNTEIAELTGTGLLTLYSTLRKGRMLSVDVLDGGTGYFDYNTSKLVFSGSSGKGAMARIAEVNASGGITRVDVIDPGEGYFDGALKLSVVDGTGTGASLIPVIGSGYLTIRAQLDSNASIFDEVNATAAGLHVLDKNTSWSWLDRYFDTFKPGVVDMSADPDADGLTNQQELVLSTNPIWSDSDGDGLDDHNESQLLGTNPLLADTDSDGLSDYVELTQYNTNATKPDTDNDGWFDGLEVQMGMDPQLVQTKGSASGVVSYAGTQSGTLVITAHNVAVGEQVGSSPYITLSQSGHYTLPDLFLDQNYTIFGFLDLNGSPNIVRDRNEPFGQYTGSWNGFLSSSQTGLHFLVEDIPPPTLTLLGNAAVDWPSGDAYDMVVDDLGASVVDSIDGNVTANYEIISPSGSVISEINGSSLIGNYEIRYSYVNSIGLQAETVSRTVRVEDNFPPLLTALGDSVFYQNLGEDFNESLDQGVAAYDFYDGNLTATLEGNGTTIDSSSPPGVYHRIYNATDSSGNQAVAITKTIVIQDVEPPVLQIGDVNVSREAGTSWSEIGFSAYDVGDASHADNDGNLTERVDVNGSVNHNMLGSYVLTYRVTDIVGNIAEQNRTVHIVDTTPPVLALLGDTSVSLNFGELWTEPGFTVSDNYSDLNESNVTVTGAFAVEGSIVPAGTHVRTYRAVDSEGNFAEQNRTVVVLDTIPPSISLTGGAVHHEAGQEFVEPGYEATDNVDGNLYSSVVRTGEIGSSPGNYLLTYSVNDSSGNSFSVQRTVLVTDTVDPTITLLGGNPLSHALGQPFVDPGISATDSADGDLSSKVYVLGLDQLDVNASGVYTVTYVVIDNSGNQATTTREVVVDEWVYVIQGMAMDGYLVGATVIFDIPPYDGVHDISASVETDDRGAFSIAFTPADFAKVDADGNGVIDPSEGKIIVTGGIDSSTQSPFTGSYEADANSTVVNPLTTLATALVDQGKSRQEAAATVASWLGIAGGIDLANYDPIVGAAGGGAGSGTAFAASTRMATAMKQVSAFIKFASDGDADEKLASSQLVDGLANKLAAGDMTALGDLDAMTSVLTTVSTDMGYSSFLSSSDIAGAAALIGAADELIVDTCSSSSGSTTLAVDLVKIQAVVEESVVKGYDQLTLEGGTPSGLSASLSKEMLAGQMSSYSNMNVFPPIALDAEIALPSDHWINTHLIHALGASDADGDEIQYSISSGNPDSDKDGTAAFEVNAQGNVLVKDSDELENLSNGIATLEFLLSDSRGLFGKATVTVRIGNALALGSGAIAGTEKWWTSEWMGNFFSDESSWVYHEHLGWLYVSPAGTSGYWFWSANQASWLWTSAEAYPYLYKNSVGWLYLDTETDPKIYDYTNQTWLNP